MSPVSVSWARRNTELATTDLAQVLLSFAILITPVGEIWGFLFKFGNNDEFRVPLHFSSKI